ncbi:hypothetical protein LZ32DRAFT_418544 [Colletotrichum eremochloae]|nr:hypothetical protein LZ32DRAFT_418544 [Colletotrichum eremochloae]
MKPNLNHHNSELLGLSTLSFRQAAIIITTTISWLCLVLGAVCQLIPASTWVEERERERTFAR